MVRRFSLGLGAFCLALIALAAPAQAQTTGISGNVKRASDNAPLQSVSVFAYTNQGFFSGSASTDPSGNYSITGLSGGGSYFVVTSNFAGLMDQVYKTTGNVSCGGCAPASVGGAVPVTSGSVTQNINFALPAGARISGRVTDSAGAALAGVNVNIFLQSNSFFAGSFGSTDSSGNFIGGAALPPGTYAAVTSNTQGFIDRIYDAIPCPAANCGLASGTGIVVVGTTDRTGINFALPKGGFVTGTITNSSTSAVVSGASVSIFNTSGNNVAFASTNGSGVYTTSGLPDGTYFARAQVFSGPSLVPQLFDSIPCLSCSVTSGTPITVTAPSGSTANFAMQPAGTITGTIKDASTTLPLSNVSVQIYPASGGFSALAFTNTNSSGVFSAGGLATGSYLVRAFGSFGSPYISRVYLSGATGGGFDCVNCDITGGSLVSVTAGTTTPAIDMSLTKGGTITGSVSDDATTSPLNNVSITVLNTGGGFVTGGSTNSSGVYTVGGLLPGTYYVRTNSSPSLPYIPEIYAGGGTTHVICNFCSVASGTPLTVSTSGTVSGINFKLRLGVSISGTVTDNAATPSPLQNISVTAFDGGGAFLGGTSTNSAGQYTLAGLTPGVYFLKAFGNAGLMDQLYLNIPCQNCSANGGTPIDLTAGSKTGVNFALAAGGRISGKIFDNNGVGLGSTSSGGVGVTIFNESGSLVANATADGSGNFITSTGLPTGKYYALSFNGFGYINTLYNNIGCFGCPATSGTPIVVTAGSTATGINFTLMPGARITGTLKSSATGNPVLVNAGVQVYSSTGSFLSSTFTNSVGNYTFGGLPTGVYFVRTNNGLGFIDQLNVGAPCLGCDVTTGTPVAATVGSTTTGIDFTLTAGGNLAGSVKDAVTAAGLGSVTVQVYNSTGQFVGSGNSQADGSYIVKGLGTGLYFARTFNNLGYINLLKGSAADMPCGSCIITAGAPISVAVGATTPSINFALNLGGTLKGSVKTTDTTPVPIPGVSVSLVTSTGSFVSSNSTDGQGNYTLSGIVPGDYFLKTFNSRGYIDQVYNGLDCVNCTVSAGTPITITQGVVVTGKDFALNPGGRISGTVTDNATTPNPLSGITVEVYRATGSFVSSTTTTATGAWVSATGLPPGDYVVKTRNTLGYVDRLYDAITCLSCSVTSGKTITLTSGAAVMLDGEGPALASVTSAGGVNFALAPGGGITGKVLTTGSTPVPIQGAFVQIYSDTGAFISSTSTNGEGRFVLRGVPTGTYFAKTSNSLGFIDQLYSSVSCTSCGVTSGTPISVTVGAITPNIDFSLTTGGRITGTVTAAAGGAPISNVSISVYSTSGLFMASGFTSPAGNYVTGGLPAGNYLVRTSFNSSGFINMVHGSPADIPCQSCSTTVGAPVTVTLGSATPVVFSLAVGGSITGTVREAGGPNAQFGQVSVSAYTTQGTFMGSNSTDNSGVYTVSGLPTGSYVLRTFNSVGFIDQQYDGQICQGCSFSNGTTVTVTAGAPTTSINFALTRGGRISGTVKDLVGNPIPNIGVQIFSPSGTFVTSTNTDNLGNYITQSGLATGSYFARTINSTGWINVIYPSSTCQNCPVTTGSPIPVTVAQTTPGIAFTLAKGARITGTITDAVTGQPLNGVGVSVYLADGTSVGGTGTNFSGGYSTQGLPTGTYYVRTNNGLGYVNRLYDALDCVRCAVSSGTPVAVTAGDVRSGVNFALSPGGRISGVITDAAGVPLPGIFVNVFDSAGFGVTSATTNAAGAYTTFSGLTSGAYYVKTSNSVGYVNKLYDSFTCLQCNPITGKPVVVATGATTSGINFALSAGGRIAGTVSGGGTGLTGARVDIFSSSGLFLTGTQAGTGGQYITGEGLPPGTYYLVSENISGFIDQLYDGNSCGFACAVTNGKGVVVAGAATTSSIDFNLTPGGRISGRVTDKATGNGIANVEVDIYNSTGATVAYGVTDGLGNYKSFGGVATGNYFAQTFYSSRTTPYVSKVYNDVTCPACNPTTGTPIAVTTGGLTSGIDFALETGEVISGTVTEAGTGKPIAGARVILVNSNGLFVGSGRTDDAGLYVITSAVSAGSYFAKTSNGLGYVDKVFDNTICLACDVTRGTPIVVDGVGSTTGINFALTAGGRITGTVTAASGGAPVAGSAMRFFNAAGSFIGQTFTNGVGTYTSPGLPPGNYFVRTQNTSGFIDKLYSNAPCAPCTMSQGTAVTVVTAGLKGGIDFALDSGGLISGFVKDQATGSPIKGVTVSVYRVSDGVLVATTDPTDANGYYRISLPVGTYQVEPNPVAGFRPALAALRGPLARSTVTVTTDTETTGVGFSLVACAPLTVNPATLPLGAQGQLYSTTLTATGGTAPFTFSISDGNPNTGLALAASGLLAGTPVFAGTGNFTVAAIDANQCAGSRVFALTACSFFLSTTSQSTTANAGTGTVNLTASAPDCPWVVTTTAPWITITSTASGTGNATVTFSYTFNSSGAARSGVIRIGGQAFTVTQAASSSRAAFGQVDTPAPGATGVVGSLAVTGWALDDVEVKRVKISRDPVAGEGLTGDVYLGDATFVEGARPDVAAVNPGVPFNTRAGWGYLLLSNMLPGQGNGTYTLHLDAVDAEGNVTRLGNRTFMADNANSVRPFGAIDTPGQGATIAGSSFVNFGWALTPNPKRVPTDGSTITVYIDSVAAGNPTYNQFRGDVAGLFPGLANTGGAIGFKYFDTTTWTNGVHTISWVVFDDAGQGEGIGSRYFTVNNALASQRLAPPSVSALRANASTGSGGGPVASARVGFDRTQPALELMPDALGGRFVAVGQLGRVELRFGQACGAVSAVQITNGERVSLPVGATLDPSGAFFWMPGPAFLGTYNLEFSVPSCGGRETKIPIAIAVGPGR
jgi:carboxypeptidase family protein